MKENLTTTGPPTYVWSLGDVLPGTRSGAYVRFNLDRPDVAPVTFTLTQVIIPSIVKTLHFELALGMNVTTVYCYRMFSGIITENCR